jgi:hypothetical protein
MLKNSLSAKKLAASRATRVPSALLSEPRIFGEVASIEGNDFGDAAIGEDGDEDNW